MLLEICDAGIVFLPGAAGTVQEVFQDACENYYADATAVAPMVLVGREHWTETVPGLAAARRARGRRAMEQHVHLVDTPRRRQRSSPPLVEEGRRPVSKPAS